MLAWMLLLILADEMLITGSMLGQLDNWMFVWSNVCFHTCARLLLALTLLALIMPIAWRQLATIDLGNCLARTVKFGQNMIEFELDNGLTWNPLPSPVAFHVCAQTDPLPSEDFFVFTAHCCHTCGEDCFEFGIKFAQN
jgi:hypothetical protein